MHIFAATFKVPQKKQKRRARDSNPQPASRHLISSQAANRSRTLRMTPQVAPIQQFTAIAICRTYDDVSPQFYHKFSCSKALPHALATTLVNWDVCGNTATANGGIEFPCRFRGGSVGQCRCNGLNCIGHRNVDRARAPHTGHRITNHHRGGVKNTSLGSLRSNGGDIFHSPHVLRRSGQIPHPNKLSLKRKLFVTTVHRFVDVQRCGAAADRPFSS